MEMSEEGSASCLLHGGFFADLFFSHEDKNDMFFRKVG
jgi:hypothetical protein